MIEKGSDQEFLRMSAGFDFDDVEGPTPESARPMVDRLSKAKAMRKTASEKDAPRLDREIKTLEYWLARQRHAARSKSAAAGQRR